jgi:cob(I)alamin adenosyltransferase
MAFRIYTKTGDSGETALFGGTRVPKNHIRVEAYGTLDELNSHIGLLRDLMGSLPETAPRETYQTVLKSVQDRLFTLGAILASDPSKNNIIKLDLTEADIEVFEHQIDSMEETLPVLKNFILPGGHPTVSYCNIARTVCRRAERLVVALNQYEKLGNRSSEGSPVDSIRYLNRLSDYLFVLGRKVGQDLGVAEIIWTARS